MSREFFNNALYKVINSTSLETLQRAVENSPDRETPFAKNVLFRLKLHGIKAQDALGRMTDKEYIESIADLRSDNDLLRTEDPNLTQSTEVRRLATTGHLELPDSIK